MARHCEVCGHEIPAPRSRSVPQHRRYFAMIKAVYDQWPESHSFQPVDREHLRLWLQCRAGYYTVADVPVPDLSDINAKVPERLRAFLPPEDYWRQHFMAVAKGVVSVITRLRTRGYVFIRSGPDGVKVFQPKSINFHTIGPSEFGRLKDAVTDAIWNETNLDADQVLRESERNA